MEGFLGDINDCLPTLNTAEQGNNSQTVEEESSTEESLMPPSQSVLPQHPRRRAKGTEYLINEASKQMKDTFNTLNSTLKSKKTEEDEWDLYCKLLAKKLRGLPEKERTIFMYEIDGRFINRLRNCSIPSRPTSSQSSYSEPSPPAFRKRPHSTCTSYSEPALVTYPPTLQYIPDQNTYADPPQQSTAHMPSQPAIIAPDPPVLHIPDPNNSQSVTILSDQLVVSPTRHYIETFNCSQDE